MELPAIATVDQAAALAAALPAALAALPNAQSPLRIDASALAELDSSTIALLLQARRLAQAQGRQLEIAGAPPKLQSLATLYGVDSLLPLSSSP